MSGINKAIILGNVGKDPETKYTGDGKAVCNLTIATSESWKDKNTGQKQERTEWHRVVFFGKLADIVAQYVSKGSSIYIEGQIRTRKWQNANGADQYTTEIVAKEMQLLGGKGDAGKQHQPAPSADLYEHLNDDIPF